MLTERTSSPRPGTLAAKRSRIPSSGWIRIASRFGSGSAPALRKSIMGGRLNWTAISVARRGRRLPVRRKKGTPAQRQLCTPTRRAT